MIRVFRVRVLRVNSANDARHKRSQPSDQKPGLNPGEPLVRCLQSKTSLVTDCAWTPGNKLGFLGLGFLGLTQPMGQGKERASPAGQTWHKSRRPTCRMLTEKGWPSDIPCLDSREQVGVSRVSFLGSTQPMGQGTEIGSPPG